MATYNVIITSPVKFAVNNCPYYTVILQATTDFGGTGMVIHVFPKSHGDLFKQIDACANEHEFFPCTLPTTLQGEMKTVKCKPYHYQANFYSPTNETWEVVNRTKTERIKFFVE